MSTGTVFLFIGGFICGGALTMILLATLSRLTRRNQELELYSNCCGAHPDGELYDDSYGVYSGRCSKCKEGAVFGQIEDER